jgi:hypothetical protein
MRRRPIILLLLATAALTGAAIALADAPATGPAVKVLAETPDAQVGPAVAVNPAGGSPNIAAAAVGTDWQLGVQRPQSASSSGSIAAATGTPTWSAQQVLAHTSGGDVGGGSPDIVWGPGNKVYAVEQGRDSTEPFNPCAAGAGIYFFVSTNGGASWSSPTELLTNSASVAFSEPSIDYNAETGRIYVTYTRTEPCSGPNQISIIRMSSMTNDNATGLIPPTAVSPQGSHYVHPSMTTLPGGGVAIAYYDATQNPGNVRVTICQPSAAITSVPVCGATATVDPAALDPLTLVQNIQVDVRPRIAADPSGRIVVVWAKQTDANGIDVFSATSRGAPTFAFGAPQLISAGGGTSAQIDPTVALTSDGRADVAFLDNRTGDGFRVAASASNRPSAGGTTETWTPSIAVESAPIMPVSTTTPGAPSLGGRLGIAEVPHGSGLPWTLIAWTDTRNVSGSTPRNEDVYSTVMLHGTTAPVGVDVPTSAPFPVQRNLTSPVPIQATDADGDPLTYTLLQNGTNGVAAIPDPNVPQLSYQAGNALLPDQLKVTASDGVNSTIVTINVQAVNTAPVIQCTSLATLVDKPLAIPASCATDANGDPVTLDARDPAHGTITRPGGVLTFVPEKGFVGAAFVTLTATDGTDAAIPRTIRIDVSLPPEPSVLIAGEKTRKAVTNRPIMLRASVSASTLSASASIASVERKIVWSYKDRSPGDQGPSVTHLFTRAGTYKVTAGVGDGTPDTVTVFVTKPPLSLNGTDLRGGTMSLRVQLASAGRLSISLMGVPNAHQRKVKLKRGTHTVRMTLPARARTRGTVVVKLTLTLATGGTAKLKRAVLLPPD